MPAKSRKAGCAPARPRLALETPPRGSAVHAWADYIELLCLTDQDRDFTMADLLDRVRERKDLGEGIVLPEADEEEAPGLELGDEPDIEPESEPGQPTLATKDREEAMARQFFDHLRYRMAAFDDFYPFKLNKRNDRLHGNRRFSTRQNLYLFLLLSANHSRIAGESQLLTHGFEVVSREALTALMPTAAKVKLFGSGNKASDYYGNKYAKVKALAQDLGVPVKIKKSEFPSRDVGDAGLDIVAYYPFNDGAPNLLSVFAQCGCTPEWIEKQHSSSSQRWNSILTLDVFPQNLVFIPFCLRDTGGGWHRPSDIGQAVMIDRLRLLRLLGERKATLPDQAAELVQRIASSHASLF